MIKAKMTREEFDDKWEPIKGIVYHIGCARFEFVNADTDEDDIIHLDAAWRATVSVQFDIPAIESLRVNWGGGPTFYSDIKRSVRDWATMTAPEDFCPQDFRQSSTGPEAKYNGRWFSVNGTSMDDISEVRFEVPA